MSELVTYRIAALYHFTKFDDPERIRDICLHICHKHNILGALIIAEEGVNGTISGKSNQLDEFFDDLGESVPDLRDIQEIKFSDSKEPPFHRMRIKIKPEIVTMGCPEINPAILKGTYVESKEWNEVISDPDVLLLDTRNDYEIDVGTFKNAINPMTKTFKEFPEYVDKLLLSNPSIRSKKVAMYCTGGVRCEKASAFLMNKGFDNVFHLKGGILKYLEDIPKDNSLWDGECYVFDQRTAVGFGVTEGQHTVCRSCRHPLIFEETVLNIDHKYEEGVSCTYCFDELTDKKRDAARERNMQIQLAEAKGMKHLGYNPKPGKKSRQREKKKRDFSSSSTSHNNNNKSTSNEIESDVSIDDICLEQCILDL